MASLTSLTSHLRPQTLGLPVGEAAMWVLALVAELPVRSGSVRRAETRRKRWANPNCTSAADVIPCGTVGGPARRQTGRRTSPRARSCKPPQKGDCSAQGVPCRLING
jgi:hypothetical protein